MLEKLLAVVTLPGWDAGYYTGTIVTGIFVLAFMHIGRGRG